MAIGGILGVRNWRLETSSIQLRMDCPRTKNEKSFDNRCAALVSREGRAPRAGQDRKPCGVKGLRMMSPLIRARGAQVSRAARSSKFPLSRPACRALSPFRGVGGATPPPHNAEHRMSHHVTSAGHGEEFIR